MNENLLRQSQLDETLFLRPRGDWMCWVCYQPKRWLYIVDLEDGTALGTCRHCVDRTEWHQREMENLSDDRFH